MLSGAAYSNDFSTVMRTTRVAEISTDIGVEDTSGTDPLPKRIAKATIRFPASEEVELGDRLLLDDTSTAYMASGSITTMEEAYDPFTRQ